MTAPGLNCRAIPRPDEARLWTGDLIRDYYADKLIVTDAASH